MPDRVEQAQEDALSNFQTNINPGRVGALFLSWVGTNSGATPGTFSDLGSIVVKRDGRTIIDRPIYTLARKQNILFGSNLEDSTGSGAAKFTAKVPFFIKSFPQALEIAGASELNFQYKAADSSVFSDLTLTVFSVQSFLDEEYDYFLLGDDQTPAGAVSGRPYQLNASNIAAIYLEDDNDILTSAGLRQDGKQVFSDQPKQVLEGGTLTNYRLEQSTVDMMILQAYTDENPRSLLNDNSVLELTTSAGSNEIKITRESILLQQ